MVQVLPPTFSLPDLEKLFIVLPNGSTNPHCDAARSRSRHWISQYNKVIFGPKMTAFWQNCGFELSCSYTYPQLDQEGLRATMDWVNILWFVDEVTDTETGNDARRTAEVVCRTLRDPCYNDGTPLCRMIADFRINHLSRAGPETTRRFLEHCDKTFFGFSREAELRENGEVLTISDYLTLRKETSGVRTCFDLAECFMGIDIPEAIYCSDRFRRGYEASLSLVYLHRTHPPGQYANVLL